MEIKTSWEIREWVEDSIPEEKKEYVDWSEVHYDRWQKEYDETHSRDCKKWVSVDSLLEEGIEIECQANGSNNPEDLVDGIFIPYSELKRKK